MNPPSEKLNQLTFTRFLAALSVMFFHSGGDFGIFQVPAIFKSGLTAVNYFYVLSGFVMAYVNYHSTFDNRFALSKYLLFRFSRIYPVYIFSFVVTCLYYINILPKTRFKEIAANLFLYQAWFPEYSVSFNIAAWSLSVEILFYILVPFLVSFTINQSVKKLISVSIVFWIISQLVHSLLQIRFSSLLPLEFFGYFPLFHLNAFILGFVGGVWYLRQPAYQKTSSTIKLSLIILPLVAIAVAVYFRDVEHSFSRTFSLDVGLLAPFFLITILSLASSNSLFITKIFSHPWLILLGDSSYTLYILHIPIRWWFERILNHLHISLPSEVFLLIYILLTIILCLLIYKYIENPMQHWLRNHPHKLAQILIDITLIAFAIKLAFVFRLGWYDTGFLRTQRFAIFFGTVIFFILLIIFQFYKSYSWRRLAIAAVIGGVLLSAYVYYAWKRELIEGFPRPILAMIPFLVFFAVNITSLLPKFVISKRIVKANTQ